MSRGEMTTRIDAHETHETRLRDRQFWGAQAPRFFVTKDSFGEAPKPTGEAPALPESASCARNELL
jgi:hypothetical protein